jgi:hypothetical protein
MPRNCDSTVTVAILPFRSEVAVQTKRCSAIAALVASLALAACATTPSAEPPSASAAASVPAPAATPASQLRDLTPQEKKIIVDAIAPSLREPGSAKYKWAKFPMVPPSDQVSYCATVDAKSPYAAYSGHQSYIVDTKVVGGHITAAVLGLIAGGKDAKIVAGLCANHGLDPNSAT